jgi:hypothetical protein
LALQALRAFAAFTNGDGHRVVRHNRLRGRAGARLQLQLGAVPNRDRVAFLKTPVLNQLPGITRNLPPVAKIAVTGISSRWGLPWTRLSNDGRLATCVDPSRQTADHP